LEARASPKEGGAADESKRIENAFKTPLGRTRMGFSRIAGGLHERICS